MSNQKLELEEVLLQLGYLLALVESLSHYLNPEQGRSVELIKESLFYAGTR